ncbi:TRAP dicarboxylate transporter, DctM subunit, unknown substrate 5 [Olavius algarvensis associated proteobacterium Delta 3]|nr:TRAP dicarboxylate transporter, DctM subunit, unknown substrate 5 [Olavius algarvensis associated proteobacterium Delta 3]CAB5120736.1 TRAP dicarboxylate transporter, DctM subunit, unknown substrate 5 [Olavius algarvensis associated proteobacterium Delta 3]
MDASLIMSIVVFGILFLALACGIWVGFSLFIVGFLGMVLFSPLPPGPNMASSVWATIEKWEYVALPLFILMGEILYRSGISEKLFKALVPWLYRLPGGLLLMNIVSCTLFAAVSGSSAATTATVGRITLAEFDKLGYDKSLAMGSLAGAGTLGFLIPPSLIMIVYAILAEVSIGKMFMAGVLPGLLLAGVYSTYIIYRGIRNPEIAPQSQETYSWKERMLGLKDLAPTLLLILMVLGSIYGGVATPTEAAAIGVFGATVFASVNRRMNFKIMFDCLVGAVKTNAMIMLIVVGAGFLSRVMGYLGIPAAITTAITGLGLSPYLLMILLGAFYILLGCLLDGFSIVVMTLPIALPMVVAAGFDPIWFGIYLILMVEVSQITPPVGFNLFVIQGLTNEPIMRIAVYALPFFFLMLLTTAILTIFPEIALYLPELMVTK